VWDPKDVSRDSPIASQILIELHHLNNVGRTMGLLMGMEALGYRYVLCGA